jgi:hypothetical protein
MCVLRPAIIGHGRMGPLTAGGGSGRVVSERERERERVSEGGGSCGPVAVESSPGGATPCLPGILDTYFLAHL